MSDGGAAVELRRIQSADLASVYALLLANGWGKRIAGVEQLEALIDASQVAEVAVIDGQVAGFVRAITDGLSNGYLSMLVVASAHRGKGVGRALVERAMGSNTGVTWVLRAGREGAAEFFAKLGFEPSMLAMERRRA